jgi:hypothetical protein
MASERLLALLGRMKEDPALARTVMARQGYVPVHNPDSPDGKWNGEIVYAKISLSPQERITAAKRVAQEGNVIAIPAP